MMSILVFLRAQFWDPHYILPILHPSEIINRYNLKYHLFADDTQIYISFKTTHIASAKQRAEDCVTEVCHWMNINELKLKQDKTDILLIHSRYSNKPSVDEFNIELEKVLITATSVKSLGVFTVSLQVN